MVSETLARIENASKTYGNSRVLSAVDLELRAGTVRALLGENGCGKSTLVKILAGVLAADPGTSLEISGETVESDGHHSAKVFGLGVRVVHQTLGLFNELSVADNIWLGSQPPQRGWTRGIDSRRLTAVAEAACESVGLARRLGDLVGDLSAPEQALVAIARALRDAPSTGAVVVLDEPTACLPPRDVQRLLEAISRLRTNGHAVLMVTHRLDEVVDNSDEVTVLRNGRIILDRETRGMTTDDLAQAITGRAGQEARSKRAEVNRPAPDRSGRTGLSVSSLNGPHFADVTFTLRPGRITGLAGLTGSGTAEIVSAIAGATRPASGSVTVDDEVLREGSVREAIAAGCAFVGPDRKRDGLFGPLSIADNVSLNNLPVSSPGRSVSARRQAELAQDCIRSLSIRPANPAMPVEILSGGNAQKVVLGRWLDVGVKYFLLVEPTQGVDVGAREEIHALLRELATTGVGVLVASSDVEELSDVCHEVLLVRAGRIVDRLESPFHGADIASALLAGAPS